MPATNRIEFRFNGTDGDSNGFRILDLQLQDAQRRATSRPTPRRWADIAVEKAGRPHLDGRCRRGQDAVERLGPAAEVAGGEPPHARRLFVLPCGDGPRPAVLQLFQPLDRPALALPRPERDARPADRRLPARRADARCRTWPQATPWNPPYQPGPGLDSRPAVEWAAGAGIDAVLPDAKSFVNVFAGKPAGSTARGDAGRAPMRAMGSERGQGAEHARDADPAAAARLECLAAHRASAGHLDAGRWAGSGLFETKGDDGLEPDQGGQAHRRLAGRQQEPERRVRRLEPPERGPARTGDVLADRSGRETLDFVGGGRGSRVSPNPSQPYGAEIGGRKLQALLSPSTQSSASALYPNAKAGYSKEAFIERAMFGMIHWMGVKQWELAHEYGLESSTSSFRGRKDASGRWVGEGEKRGWPFDWPSVFYMAPHMLYVDEQTPQGKREFYFSWEPRLTSYYRTNQWYRCR